jgi:hypothetical protein
MEHVCLLWTVKLALSLKSCTTLKCRDGPSVAMPGVPCASWQPRWHFHLCLGGAFHVNHVLSITGQGQRLCEVSQTCLTLGYSFPLKHSVRAVFYGPLVKGQEGQEWLTCTVSPSRWLGRRQFLCQAHARWDRGRDQRPQWTSRTGTQDCD